MDRQPDSTPRKKCSVLCRSAPAGVVVGWVVLMSLVQLFVSPAIAYVPLPRRPLSEDQELSRAVYTSDAIVVARVDSTYELENPAGQPVEWASVNPIRWLKGADASPHITFWVPIDEGPAVLPTGMRPDPARPSFLFFLRSARQQWWLNASPGVWNQGVVALQRGALAETQVNRVNRTLREQSLDSLATSADLVVIASPAPEPKHAVTETAPPQVDAYYRIDRVLAGATPDSILGVVAPYFIDVMGKEPRLLFLRRAANGTYDVVRSGGGSLSLRGSGAHLFGMGIDSLAKRVRLLKTAQSRLKAAP